ncbi:MAG: nucleotidyltransferase domain-containing protein [Candidatus Woesearchaeota archaeon]|nr:MAG: nucleotidyltransferase domain-containing protein [Candidatus Woesearchaeota archaeon]
MADETLEGENYRIAYDFAGKVENRFRGLITSVILFGSVAKKMIMDDSDVDIVIVIDDTTVTTDNAFILWYRKELAKLVNEQEYKKKLHINTVTLTTFWEHLLKGEPTVVNVVRYGVAIIDPGFFFDPIKRLLANGRIRPSVEAVYNAISRTTAHIFRADQKELAAISDVYWAFVDSAHAALMAYKVTPPSPEHVPKLLRHVFVKKRKLHHKYVEWYEEIFDLEKKIVHGHVVRLDRGELDEYRHKAEEFTNKMKNLVDEKFKK